jgi:hypothetical protein
MTDSPEKIPRADKRSRTTAAEIAHLLRKPVNTLAIVPKTEKITVTARKIYNIMLLHAQKQGPLQERYHARLSDITTGIDFNSNNTELVKQYFRQMATTGVEWQSPTTGEGTRWSISALIAHADLIQRGNEIILEWSYAANIKDELLDPQRFAKMSLEVQSHLNTMPSLALYEICCRYADNPGGLTARHPWAWWRPVLTGSPESAAGAYLEYKIFNRDVLKKAIKKVNAVSDLDIELIEHKSGRAVRELQFKVARKSSAAHQPTENIMPVDLHSIGLAIKAGISQQRAEKLLQSHGAEALQEAIRIMQERQSKQGLNAVRSPDKYVTTILQSGQIAAAAAGDKVVARPFDSKAERMKLIERFMSIKRAELYAMFNEMPASDQQQWTTRFAAEALPSNDAIRRAFERNGVTSQIVRSAFLRFLGNAIWEEGWEKPSDADLVDVALELRHAAETEQAARRPGRLRSSLAGSSR